MSFVRCSLYSLLFVFFMPIIPAKGQAQSSLDATQVLKLREGQGSYLLESHYTVDKVIPLTQPCSSETAPLKTQLFPSSADSFIDYLTQSLVYTLKIQSDLTEEFNGLLEVRAPQIDDMRLYVFDAQEQLLKVLCVGDLQAHTSRPIQHAYYLLPISISQDVTLKIYVQGQQYGYRLPMVLYSEKAYLERGQKHSYVVITILGMMLLVVFYYAVLGLNGRDPFSLSYSVLLLLCALLFAQETGLAFQYLWPDSVFLQQHAIQIIFCLLPMAFAIFCYLGLKDTIETSTLRQALGVMVVAWWLVSLSFPYMLIYLFWFILLGIMLVLFSLYHLRRQSSTLLLLLALGGSVLILAPAMMVATYFDYGQSVSLLHTGLSWSGALFVLLLMGGPLSITQYTRKDLRQLQQTISVWRTDIQQLIDRLPGLVLVLDTYPSIVDANQNLLKQLGYSKNHLSALLLNDIVKFVNNQPQISEISLKEQVNALLEHPQEALLHAADGELLPISLTASPLHDDQGKFCGYIVMAKDISQLKVLHQAKIDLQKQLIKTQRTEVLGTLAGTIAHQMNNILTPAVGYADMLLALSTDPSQKDPLTEILNSAQLAKQLLQQVLAFTSGRDVKEPIALHLVIEEILPLLNAAFPKGVSIRTDIDVQTGQVLANSAQIRQALMNICANSVQACENDCVIEISLKQILVDDALKKKLINVHLNDQLGVITIKDHSQGMAQETKERVFEPFFTTKTNDQHSGLGLTIVRTIMQQHLGDILIESELGQGTEIKLYFPTLNLDSEPNTLDIHNYKAKGERVLLIDDEPAVNQVIGQMLELLGYDVTAFSDSEKALNCFIRYYGNFDVVLLDQSMPLISGGELAMRFKRIHQLPMIMMTGAVDRPLGEHYYHSKGITLRLQKPIRLKDLSQALSQVLSKPA